MSAVVTTTTKTTPSIDTPNIKTANNANNAIFTFTELIKSTKIVRNVLIVLILYDTSEDIKQNFANLKLVRDIWALIILLLTVDSPTPKESSKGQSTESEEKKSVLTGEPIGTLTDPSTLNLTHSAPLHDIIVEHNDSSIVGLSEMISQLNAAINYIRTILDKLPDEYKQFLKDNRDNPNKILLSLYKPLHYFIKHFGAFASSFNLNSPDSNESAKESGMQFLVIMMHIFEQFIKYIIKFFHNIDIVGTVLKNYGITIDENSPLLSILEKMDDPYSTELLRIAHEHSLGDGDIDLHKLLETVYPSGPISIELVETDYEQNGPFMCTSTNTGAPDTPDVTPLTDSSTIIPKGNPQSGGRYIQGTPLRKMSLHKKIEAIKYSNINNFISNWQ